MSAARGPAISCLDRRQDGDLDASFRVLSAYEPMYDTVVTRFDVLLNGVRNPNGFLTGGDQFNLALTTTAPASPEQKGPSDLPVPRGTLGGFAVKANASDLVTVLRGLADSIEGELGAKAEAA